MVVQAEVQDGNHRAANQDTDAQVVQFVAEGENTPTVALTQVERRTESQARHTTQREHEKGVVVCIDCFRINREIHIVEEQRKQCTQY